MTVALALLVLAQSSAAARPADPNAAQRQTIQAIERRWLASGDDAAALDAILADDFLHVLPSGVIGKNEQLAFMRAHPSPKDGSMKRFESLRIRVFGSAAVATGVVVATAPDGTTQRTAFTDVFAYRSGRWRAVNAQETPLQESPRSR